MVFHLRLFLLLVFIGWLQQTSAQDSSNLALVKCSNKELIGKWQLSKTFSMGAYHVVKKEDFNDVLQLKPHHQFTEEVFYESNHWILKGQWYINRKAGMLTFSGRTYITGKLEDDPQDVVLHIIQANKKLLAGKSTEKGQPIEIYYSRIPNLN